MIFKRNKVPAGLSGEQVRRLEAAAGALGLSDLRWGRDAATFQIAGSPRDLPARALARAVGPQYHGLKGRHADAVGLACALGIGLPPDAAPDWESARAMLLPRLLSEKDLSGPRRNMCRRPAFGRLIRSIAFGDGLGAPLLTTAILDLWSMEFDEVWEQAEENLRDRLPQESLEELGNACGLRTLVDPRTPGSSGVFALDHLCPEGALSEGVVFSTPRVETLLTLAVEPGAGMEGLAAIVQATHALAMDEPAALADDIFWWREGEFTHLPMTAIIESASRRIHMEAEGPVGRLLRILGVLD